MGWPLGITEMENDTFAFSIYKQWNSLKFSKPANQTNKKIPHYFWNQVNFHWFPLLFPRVHIQHQYNINQPIFPQNSVQASPHLTSALWPKHKGVASQHAHAGLSMTCWLRWTAFRGELSHEIAADRRFSYWKKYMGEMPIPFFSDHWSCSCKRPGSCTCP